MIGDNLTRRSRSRLQVGDYGLGYCANSLELGCDCLGTIHYFDADMVDSAGALSPAYSIM